MPEQDLEIYPGTDQRYSQREKLGVKEFAMRSIVVIGLGSVALGVLGNYFVDKINNEGIKPAIEEEGQQLESAFNNQAISKEDVETVIKVGCGLHNQFVIPNDEPNELTELCREYLPDELQTEQPETGGQVEIAEQHHNLVTTTTTTTP